MTGATQERSRFLAPIVKHKLSPNNDFQDPEDYNYLNHVFTWNFPEVKDVLSVSFHFIITCPLFVLESSGSIHNKNKFIIAFEFSISTMISLKL